MLEQDAMCGKGGPKLSAAASQRGPMMPAPGLAAPQEGHVVVVIPAYNEVGTIRDIVIRALRIVDAVVVVDDGSCDGTSETVADLPISIVKHEKNQGKAASLWTGFQLALANGAGAILTIDSDGQHAPEDIPLLLQAWERFPNMIIIGARKRPSWYSSRSLRVWANRIADFWISWAAGYRISDSQSGFRVYPVRLLQTLGIKHGKAQSFVFESEVLIEAARAGILSVPVEIRARPRQGLRPSHFHPIVDVLRITVMVAWRLLRRGLYLQGLYRMARGTVPVGAPRVTEGRPVLAKMHRFSWLPTPESRGREPQYFRS